jgi:hypothetical protein
MVDIRIQPVKSKAALRKFIHLPASIHKNHKNWIPPIYADEWKFFNPKKNPLFNHSETILLLALRDNRPIGRIMGIINHKYNDAKNENDGRFCFIETYNEPEVAELLLSAVEKWAREKGMNGMVGPLGFSDKDPQGLLIEGFDEPMVIATNCNYPYMVSLVEAKGYTKKVDLVVYKLLVPDVIPEFYQRIYERVIKNNKDIRLVKLNNRRQIKPYIRPVLGLVNSTFTDIYAFAPLSENEMDEFAKRYLMILDPRFIKIIENNKKEVIAFILGIPDIGDGIIKSRGYILPFGFYHILRSQKTTNRLSLLLGGIREDYRNSGLDTIMGVEMLKEARKAGLRYIDSHLELETNLKMRAEMEKMGGVVYKKYRIYQKSL